MAGKAREVWAETMFHAIYGSPVLQAAVGLKSDAAQTANRASGALQQADALVDPETDMDKGGLVAAGLRALIYVMHGSGVDERQFHAMQQIYQAASEADAEVLPVAALKDILRRQAALLRADRDRAMAAIPQMVRGNPDRAVRVAAIIDGIVGAKGKLNAETARRLRRVDDLFAGDRKIATIRKISGK